MKDRVPTPGQEGRVKITPESGGTAYYAKLEMADNPTQVGDEPIKANLLPDDVATALGLTGNPQVADALEKIKTLIDGNTTLANSKAKIVTGSYAGTNAASKTITLGFEADFLVVIMDAASSVPSRVGFGVKGGSIVTSEYYSATATWGATNIVMAASSAEGAFNLNGRTYYYIAGKA